MFHNKTKIFIALILVCLLLSVHIYAEGEKKEISIVSVDAKKDQSENPKEYAIDGNLSTRWSADGEGLWMIFDLGSEQTFDAVAISWYKGNERMYFFDLEVSNNNNSWEQVFSGESSGSKSGLEMVEFEPTKARYIKLIANGNDSNVWNSFYEIKVYAACE